MAGDSDGIENAPIDAVKMPLLSAIRDDRVVLLGLGIAAVSVVSMMRTMLAYWKDESEIKQPTPKTQYITQETEDSLGLGTLDTLLGHYNYAIRDTAAKIVCDRAVNDDSTVNRLLYGITREDYDERMRSLRTLAVITDHNSLPLFHTTRAYAAFVRSLELCLTDVEHYRLDDPHWDDYYLRDMAEKLCLMFVIQLLNKYRPDKLLRAGFVERWLARQNWGDGPEERQRNFAQYLSTKQNRITDIVDRLQESRLFGEALYRTGLVAADGPEDAADQTAEARELQHQPAGGAAAGLRLVLSIQMREQEGGEPEEEIRIEALPRNLEQSAEEQRLRHRHREAMVLNDGDRPLSRGDIIERHHDSPS